MTISIPPYKNKSTYEQCMWICFIQTTESLYLFTDGNEE